MNTLRESEIKLHMCPVNREIKIYLPPHQKQKLLSRRIWNVGGRERYCCGLLVCDAVLVLLGGYQRDWYMLT
jgi:hypothetical protein